MLVPDPTTASVPGDFESFYRAEWAPAAKLAYLLLGSWERAEEVAQDAFIAVHQQWATVDKPGPYLRTAIVNRSRDRFRRQARWQQREHLVITDAERSVAPGSGEVGDVDLLDAIRRLPSRQRAALVLRYWGGLSMAEIAEVLGVKTGTVKSLVHRGLERLRNEEGTD